MRAVRIIYAREMSRSRLRHTATLSTAAGKCTYVPLAALEQAGLGTLSQLPFSLRILLEAALRHLDGRVVTEDHLRAIAAWRPGGPASEIPFLPGRVVLQDFTGVPCVVDLAAMRDAMQALGGDPGQINPLVPCDLVIDHSVQVDAFGSASALQQNLDIEFHRNGERYEFLKWGQQSLRNFRAVPPGVGIVHQVNLEYLAGVVLTRREGGALHAFPDTVVGTDSHTTMINGLGVVGWGVGGIEAEAVMLGQPIYMLLPEVVGFELTGELREGATATDLVLTVTQMLRNKGVVNKFVEFYGDGVRRMSLADRATVANMAPEYGATVGFFPADDETLAYLRATGRSEEHVTLVRDYLRAQRLFVEADTPQPRFTDTLRLELKSVEPCLAGPKRPQDRVPLGDVKREFALSLTRPLAERGFGLGPQTLPNRATLGGDGTIGHGAVVIAAITSCTNTSNPSVMVGAGLLARNARRRGLQTASHTKTSLAPGSRVVTDYLEHSKLDEDLDALGFQTVGYGCTTCIGNSGPLPGLVSSAIKQSDLVAAAVLSGNRNFEGRVHPEVKANYLASPPLVVAYALAGRIDLDLTSEPLGTDPQGRPVFLKDLWPSSQQIRDTIRAALTPEMFRRRYASALEGTPAWQRIPAGKGDLYQWKEASTYVQKPPYFDGMPRQPRPIASIRGARVLAWLGDSVTTDHISPAGNIKKDSPAGLYLQQLGVQPGEFNSYGARRGNDRVMTRGTFANIRLRNLLVPGSEGGVTRHLPSARTMSIYDAAVEYQKAKTPLVILAGKEYGAGSSRDWAAKGTFLLGVRFVIAESYERIHRSNLVGMGVLPLQFLPGQSAQGLGLQGDEVLSVELGDDLRPGCKLQVVAEKDGKRRTFDAQCRIDTPIEVDYYRHGGILHYVLRKLLGDQPRDPVRPKPKAKSKKPRPKPRTARKRPAKTARRRHPARKRSPARRRPGSRRR
jgi:aconitate hydratase